jgi:CheY-like chemotaxis protein
VNSFTISSLITHSNGLGVFMATVVVIEDNADIADIYRNIFPQHRVFIFPDVPEAIAFLQRTRPDLVITDFYLPSGTGKDVASFMRSQSMLRDVPILGVSVDDFHRQEAQKMGMNDFLAKPLDIQEVLKVSQLLISTPRPPKRIGQNPLTPGMISALKEYTVSYRELYSRQPDAVCTGAEVLVGGQPTDEAWLRAETARLRSLSQGGGPKNYLVKLIDKLRHI